MKVIFETGTAAEFFARTKEHAKKLDRGEKIAPEIRLSFEDPADLLRVMSSERRRVLHVLNHIDSKKNTITGLATTLKRDRKAVSRDVKVLESYGLLRTWREPNPGHGVHTFVERRARKYLLSATL